MTLEQDLEKVSRMYPQFRRHINRYAIGGEEIYSKMIEVELKDIRQQFGERIYNEFNMIYQAAREVLNES